MNKGAFLAMVAAVTLIASDPAEAQLVNGSFEAGNIAGWRLNLSGEIAVQRNCNGEWEGDVTYPYAGNTIPGLDRYVRFGLNPEGVGYGSSHVVLGGGYEGFRSREQWTMDDGCAYQLSSPTGDALALEQMVHLSAGMRLSGWASLGTWCYYTDVVHSEAWVRINDVTVWTQNNRTVPPALIRNGEELRGSGWQQWGYTVPEDGDYLVALSMSEVCQFGGYAHSTPSRSCRSRAHCS